MRRVLFTIVLCAVVIATGATSASAQGRAIVEHVSLQSEPYTLDLSDPTGSAQCDVQAVGYDTGVVNFITVFDANGVPSRNVFIQSLTTILTNPDNGKFIELRAANVRTTSYTFSADGSLTLVGKLSGLNVLNQGEPRFVSAGHQQITLFITFDEAGNVNSVEVVEEFVTPQLVHAFPFFCAMLT